MYQPFIPDIDIAIIGAGPVGIALALGLAPYCNDPSRILLVDSRSAQDTSLKADARSLAINFGSQLFLESLDAWPTHGYPIETVHISQSHKFGRTRIDAQDFGLKALGNVIAYSHLNERLQRCLENTGVMWRRGLKAQISEQKKDYSILKVGDDTISCRLLVVAEGGTFEQQPAKDIQRAYSQQALVATVKATAPLNTWAFERFTRKGSVALLPKGSGEYGLVWCQAANEHKRFVDLNNQEFSTSLTRVFGARLGELKVEGPRTIYPLGLNIQRKQVSGLQVNIGNAAQTLHPIAGQGLNLGLRDAAVLARELLPWLLEKNLDLPSVLASFERKRRADRWLTIAITHTLPRLFTSQVAALEHAAGSVLAILDCFELARWPLAQQLMLGLR